MTDNKANEMELNWRVLLVDEPPANEEAEPPNFDLANWQFSANATAHEEEESVANMEQLPQNCHNVYVNNDVMAMDPTLYPKSYWQSQAGEAHRIALVTGVLSRTSRLSEHDIQVLNLYNSFKMADPYMN